MDKVLRFPSLFYRQRLNAVSFALLTGVVLFLYAPTIAPYLLPTLVFLLLAIAVWTPWEPRQTLLFMAVGFSVALVLLGVTLFEKDKAKDYDGVTAQAEGYVLFSDEEEFDLALVSFQGKPFYKTVRCTADFLPAMGEKIQGELSLHTPYPESCRSEGISFLGKWQKTSNTTGKSIFFTAVSSVRSHLRSSFGDGETGALLRALILGETDALDKATKEAFQNTASSHLLAVSGLHVSALFALLVVIGSILPVPKRYLRFLIYPALLLFFLVTGASVSAFRSCFMCLFALGVSQFRQESHPPTTLFLTASFLLIAEPYTVESLSFQLSFASTAGILLFSEPLCRLLHEQISDKSEGLRKTVKKFLCGMADSFFLSAGVALFTFPIQALVFREVQVLTPLFNLLLVPLFAPCMYFGIAMALTTWLPPLYTLISFLSELYIRMFLWLVRQLSSGAPPPLFLGSWAIPLAAMFFAILFFFFTTRRKIVWGLYLYLLLVVLCSLLSIVV